MNTDDNPLVVSHSLNCNGCGSILHYVPGTTLLKCEHCGNANEIDLSETDEDLGAYDYDEFLESIEASSPSADLQQVKCQNCGSKTALPKNVTADHCPFCSSPLIIDLDSDQGYVKPHYILPFVIDENIAKEKFNKWIKGLSLAPQDLKEKTTGSSSMLNGVYIPYWSYDALTGTEYTGERGDHYWTREIYFEEVDGENVERSREVRHTNWFPVSGYVNNQFENILVSASQSLPPKTLNTIGKWDFSKLVEYNEMFVSGFRAESYQISPQDGLELAKKTMIAPINNTVVNDIGGNEQRVFDLSTEFEETAIRYILLPVWISSFNYKGKFYQFAINACTGDVSGDRPWSAAKIISLILAILISLVIIIYVFATHHAG